MVLSVEVPVNSLENREERESEASRPAINRQTPKTMTPLPTNLRMFTSLP